MTNGSSVMQRCISLAGGALSPDLRVNYEFGLVLGVNEFRQEQMYHLEKNYLHHRALHGYGRVSGLVVTVGLPEGATDYQISVSPGTGVDQLGRPFVVRTTQCAFLGAWLNRQSTLPSPDENGVRSVYVVASYAECLDALVTVAGQPCASSDQTQVPSRIRRLGQHSAAHHTARNARLGCCPAFCAAVGGCGYCGQSRCDHSDRG